jgi:hypothetical protein
VRREARQQYRLLRQLIAAGTEDHLLDLISARSEALVPAFEAAVVLGAARVLVRCDPMPIASSVLTSGHAGRRRPGRIALCFGGVGG